MKRNQVVLIYGLPASGKYTAAKKIQEEFGGFLFDNHYFYDLFADKVEVSDAEWLEYTKYIVDIRKIFLDVLGKYHPRKRYARYIFTSVILRGEKLHARLKKFARDINADFIPIELNVSSEALLKRCDTEFRRKRNKISDREKYKKQLVHWMPNAFHSRNPNRLVVDSSNLTFDETFKQIEKHLKKFD